MLGTGTCPNSIFGKACVKICTRARVCVCVRTQACTAAKCPFPGMTDVCFPKNCSMEQQKPHSYVVPEGTLMHMIMVRLGDSSVWVLVLFISILFFTNDFLVSRGAHLSAGGCQEEEKDKHPFRFVFRKNNEMARP